MPTLTMSQMISYARAAGFTGNNLIIAGAVGMAESGGRTDVHNPTLPYVVGTWQINTRAHPQYSEAQMEDPAQNARAAYAIWRSSGWQAWSTYTNGAYRSHMAEATKAAAAGGASADIGSIGGPLNPINVGTNLGSVMHLISELQDPAVWRRVAFVLVGIVMILIGVIKMSATPRNIQMAAKIAEVVPK